MKKYIALAASTNSEWDNVTFGLLQIDKSSLKKMKKLVKLAEDLNKKHSIASFNMYYIFDYEIFNDDAYKDGDIVLTNNILLLNTPENALTGGMITIYPNSITFEQYGKHTGEEFWMDISKDKIDELCQEYL